MRNSIRYCLLFTFLSLLSTGAVAAEKVNINITPSKTAAQGLLSNKDINQLLAVTEGYQLKAIKTVTLPNGQLITRYQQYYQGIPVSGQSLAVRSLATTGEIQTASGTILKEIEFDIFSEQIKNIQLDSRQAFEKAVAHDSRKNINKPSGSNKKSSNAFENIQTNLMIIQDKIGNARLVYEVSWVDYDKHEPRRPYKILDANSGEILLEWEGLTHRDATGPGGNIKIGQYEYGTDFPPLLVDDDCRMSSPNVDTINLNGATSGGSIHQFTCPRNTVKEINGAFSPLNDAHFFGNVVFDMFKEWYNITPLTQKLTMRVHYGNNFENAFWDGRQMTFGDGVTRFHPLVSLDIVAHEVSHGFTEQNSNLVYNNESGGINESFSDIAGEAAEYFMRGSNDFLVGADITKTTDALRYMQDPTLDGRSIGHARDFRNSMGVHFSSGVFNRAFYLLASSNGWNTRKAFDVFVLANQMYWNRFTDFYEGACGVHRASADLEYDQAAIETAFAKVGVAICSEESTGEETGLSAAAGEWLYFPVEVPEGSIALNVSLFDGVGDASLYLQLGSKPSTTRYLCRSRTYSNSENCYINGIRGTWYIGIYADHNLAFSGLNMAWLIKPQL